jgi:two-component system CheB/CheR fusion protein
LELQRREFIHYESVPIETKKGNVIYIDFTSNIYFKDYNKIIQCFIHEVNKPQLHKEVIGLSK